MSNLTDTEAVFLASDGRIEILREIVSGRITMAVDRDVIHNLSFGDRFLADEQNRQNLLWLALSHQGAEAANWLTCLLAICCKERARYFPPATTDE